MVDGILSEIGLTDEELNKRLKQQAGIDITEPNIAAELQGEISLLQAEQPNQAIASNIQPQQAISTPTVQTTTQPQQSTQSLIDNLVRQQLLQTTQPQQGPQTQQPVTPSAPIGGRSRTTGALAGISQALAGIGASIAGRDPTKAITATRKIQQEQDLIDPNSKISRTAQENLKRIREANPSQFGFLTDEVIKGISASDQNLILSPLKLLNSLKSKQPSVAEALRTAIAAENLKAREKQLDIFESEAARREKGQAFRISDTFFKRNEKFINTFNKDKIVQDSRAALAKVGVAKEVISSGNLLARSVASRLLSRLSGEVGVMTDADVRAFEFSSKAGVENWIKSKLQQFVKGTLSRKERETMLGLIDRMGRRHRENIREQADVFVKQRSGFTGQNQESLFNLLVPIGTTISEDSLQTERKFVLEGDSEPTKQQSTQPIKQAPKSPGSLQDFIKKNKFEVVQ